MTTLRVTDDGALARIAQDLAVAPRQLAAALSQTHRRLQPALHRQLDRIIATAIDLPPDRWSRTRRLRATTLGPDGRDGVAFWIGTNPLAVQRFGPVSWSRRMVGAQVGGRTYPGTWSWGRGKTGAAVMQRTGQFGRNGRPSLERIAVSTVTIHRVIHQALRASHPELRRQYLAQVRRDLQGHLTVFGRARG